MPCLRESRLMMLPGYNQLRLPIGRSFYMADLPWTNPHFVNVAAVDYWYLRMSAWMSDRLRAKGFSSRSEGGKASIASAAALRFA